MERLTCDSCAYWNSGEDRGECRHNSPQLVPIVNIVNGKKQAVGLNAAWPKTASTDWCGQHTQVRGWGIVRVHREVDGIRIRGSLLNQLELHNIKTASDLHNLGPEGINRMKNCGKSAIETARSWLDRLGAPPW